MKKNTNILTLILVILALGVWYFCIHDSRRADYIKRHKQNYDTGHIISRDTNPYLPGRAEVYDAEDFRAGAMDACRVIKQTFGEDLCDRANYWGVLGPRI